MRIFSKFHDYYDSVRAYGSDETIVYNRVEEEVKLTQKLGQNSNEVYPFPTYYYNKGGNYNWMSLGYKYDSKMEINEYTIGFCGKLYPCLRLRRPITYISTDDDKYIDYCYNLNHIDGFVNDVYDDARDIDVYNLTNVAVPKNRRGYLKQTRKEFETFFNYFDEWVKTNTACWKPFFEKAPIFVGSFSPYRGNFSSITYNSPLKPYKFYRVVDTHTAFQELSMWMGNIAFPVKPIPKLDNETMRDIKGFDKYSFRKDKEKK